MSIMQNTATALCKEIQGARLAYVQSDEISILLTDFDSEGTEAWFDGNVQKIVSISAAMATAFFDRARSLMLKQVRETGNNLLADGLALFDSRVFTIPDPIEVENSFIWRQQDASRNSVQMAARSMYSHRDCRNKNNSQLQEMMHEKGVNWNDYSVHERRGATIIKEEYEAKGLDGEVVQRSRWIVDEPPIFTKDRDYLRNLIPRIGE